MAVSISTITKSAGWARSDVILALEEAFEIVEFHGATQVVSLHLLLKKMVEKMIIMSINIGMM